MRALKSARSRASKVALGATGAVVASGGIVAIMLGSGGSALASTPGVTYGNPVEVSVTVPSSTTLHLSTNQPTLSFGSPTVLPAILGPTNSVAAGTSYTGTGAPVSTAVTGTIVSNDPAGYVVSVQGNDQPFNTTSETNPIFGIAGSVLPATSLAARATRR